METLPETQHRVTTTERERAIGHLQEAYIRGQLNERELGERIDRALSAVVKVDQTELVGDLPAIAVATPSLTVRTPWWRRRKHENVYKSTVRKDGNWTVPAFYRSRVYKGMLILDLRQAVLSAKETIIDLNAFKSRVAIIVPQDYNVELKVNAYKGSLENLLPGGIVNAPTLVIQGSAYKCSVIVADRSQETSAP